MDPRLRCVLFAYSVRKMVCVIPRITREAGLPNEDNPRITREAGLLQSDYQTEPLKRLQRTVRDPRAWYEQSLAVLKHAKLSKEGIMLGLGETDDELKEAMADLRAIDVDILTLGQYLQPTPLHLTVKEYVIPEKTAFWKDYGESIGFRYVASGSLVRFL